MDFIAILKNYYIYLVYLNRPLLEERKKCVIYGLCCVCEWNGMEKNWAQATSSEGMVFV